MYEENDNNTVQEERQAATSGLNNGANDQNDQYGTGANGAGYQNNPYGTDVNGASYQNNPYGTGVNGTGYQNNGYQNNGYQNSGYGNSYQNPPVYYNVNGQKENSNESQAFGITSLVLGIVALLLFCTCINVPIAIIGLVFGIVQLVRSEKRGLAIGGVVTCALSLLLTILLYGTIFSDDSFGDFYHEFYEEYESEFLDYTEEPQDWQEIINGIYEGGQEI